MISDDDVWHVMPNGDFREHETSRDCWCKPVEHDETPDLWLHNSMDRRENYEEGKLRLS